MNFKKHKLFLLTLTAVSMISIVGCGASKGAAGTSASQESQEQESQKTVESDFFSTMNSTDLDGNKVDKTLFAENKLTLVNMWNTGCTGCVQEIPALDKLNKEYAEKGVAIKGLYYEFSAGIADSTRKEVKEIMGKAKADYQQLLVSEEMSKSEFFKGMLAFPTTFFVDSNGEVVETLEGSYTYEGWKEKIEDALKKVESNV